MKIINQESLKLDPTQEQVFYLGEHFILQGSSLFNVIRCLSGDSTIVDVHEKSLEPLAPFYEVAPDFRSLEDAPREGNWLILYPGPQDYPYLERLRAQNPLILLRSTSEAYSIAEELGGEWQFLVPETKEEKPLHVRDLPDPENPYAFRDLFALKGQGAEALGVRLWQLYGLEPQRGNLYAHFNELARKEKARYMGLLEEKLPGGALDAAWEAYGSRPLSLMESIEKSLMEEMYQEIPAYLKKLLQEDPKAFAYAYEIAQYLELRASSQVSQGAYEAITGTLVKDGAVAIDKVYLPMVYERFAALCLRTGDPIRAARVYREFANLELARNELKNIRSNFIRKELECHFLAGNYPGLKALKGELGDADYMLREDAIAGYSYLALAHNEMQEYEFALDILDVYQLKTPEMVFFRYLLLYNKGSLTLEEYQEGIREDRSAASGILRIYYEYLRVLLQFRDGFAVDSIKPLNNMAEEAEKLSDNPRKRQIIALASLLKGRSLMQIGRMKDSMDEYRGILDCFGADQEESHRSLAYSSLREMVHLEKAMGDEHAAAQRIEEAMAYPWNPEKEYDSLNRGRILIARVDTYNHLIKDDQEALSEAEALLRKEEKNIRFRRLLAMLYKIRVGHLMKSQTESALALASEAWDQFKDEKDGEISLHLYHILDQVKQSARESGQWASYEDTLRKITGKYPGSLPEDLDLQGALALKELADHLYQKEEKAESQKVYGRFIEGYLKQDSKRLSMPLTEAMVRMAEMLHIRKNHEEALDLLSKLPERPKGAFLHQGDLLRAQCQDSLNHFEEAIAAYEAYLEDLREFPLDKGRLGEVYWNLARLHGKVGDPRTAESYLNEIISMEESPIKLLEAYAHKGNLFLEKDRTHGLDIFREGIRRFLDSQDSAVTEYIISVFGKLGRDLALFDTDLAREAALKAVYIYDSLSRTAREDLYKFLKNAAQAMEEDGREGDERWFREQLVQVYKDEGGLSYQLEIARSLYRLMRLSIANGFHYQIEDNYTALKEYTGDHKDPAVREFYYKGMMAYAIDYFNRQSFQEAKEILAELLKGQDFPEARFYYARAIEAMGDRKGALKELNRLVEGEPGAGEELDVYFEAALIRISFIKGQPGIFNRNLRKLIHEIEGKLLPLSITGGDKSHELLLTLELSLIYELLQQKEKGDRLLQDVAEKYKGSEEFRVKAALKKVNKALGKIV